MRAPRRVCSPIAVPRRVFTPVLVSLSALLFAASSHAGWQSGGVQLATFPAEGYVEWGSMVPNGSGGAIVSWMHTFTYPYPSDRSDFELRAQQVDENGDIPAPWPAAGAVVRAWSWQNPGSASITPMPLLTDGAGGAIAPETSLENIVEYINRFHLFRLASNGTVTGVPGYSGSYTGPAATSVQVDVDGAGGIIMMAIQETFAGPPNTPPPGDLYAQRVDPQGNALWSPRPVFCNSGILGGGWDVLADGTGGGFFAWCEEAGGGVFELFVQHLDGTGSLAPGWPVDGRLVRSGTGAVSRVMLAPDGTEGAIVVWRDERNGEPHLFAHHVTAAGAVDSAIPANGRALASGNLNDEIVNVASDAQEGVFVIRDSHDNFSNRQSRLYRLDPAMLPHAGWPAEGRLMPGRGVMAPDGSGGTFLAWYLTDEYPYDLFAQHLASDGSPAPGWTESGYQLTSAVASFDIVRSGAGAIVAWIDRRPDAPGLYAQQLLTNGVVGVPAPPFEPGRLALRAPYPNPGTGPATFSVTLPTQAPGSIELLDLQGRRIAHRDLGSFDAGQHMVTIDEAATVAPGVYLTRLSHGTEMRTVRLIRIR